MVQAEAAPVLPSTTHVRLALPGHQTTAVCLTDCIAVLSDRGQLNR